MGFLETIGWRKQSPAVENNPDRKNTARTFGNRWDTDPAMAALADAYLGPAENPHPVLAYQLTKTGAGYRDEAIGLLVETYQKDPYIMGLVKSRVANVLQFDSAVLQYDNTPDALEASLLIDRFVEMSGWTRILEEALERALVFGISVHERIWDIETFPLGQSRRKARRDREDGSRDRSRTWDFPYRMRQVSPMRVAFDPLGRLLIKASFRSEGDAAKAGYTKSDHEDWWYPHPMNVLVFTRFQDYDNPYGYPLLATLFMKAWLKRQQDIAWAQYNDRNSGPLGEAYYTDKDAIPISDEDKTKVERLVGNVMKQAGAIMPPGMRLQLHELSSMSGLISYGEMIRYVDQQAAVLIVGQPSTSTTSKQGTQAQSDVHERNAHALYAADAAALERFSNEVFAGIVRMNLPRARWKCPWLNINTASAAEVFKKLEGIEKAVAMGAQVPEREAIRILGVDSPLPGDRVLQPVKQSAPSQQASRKSPARQGQRDRKRDPQGQKQQPDNKVN